MSISKEQLKEEIKKQLFQQMLEQKMVDEGVTDFLKKMGQKALSGVSNVAKKGADALEKVDVDEKKLNKIADFLQMAQPDAELSKLILTTKLGKAILGGEEQNKSLQEILTGDFAQMMKAKKITNSDIDDFIKAMSANVKASKMLKELGIDVPQAQPDKSSTPSQDQPSQQTAQTQSTQEKPGATQPEVSTDNIIAVLKGKTKTAKGSSDSLHTQLTRQFGNVPESGKLITAIAKDVLNQLKVNGLKVQESVAQIEQFLLKEVVHSLDSNCLSLLLKEELSLDYQIAGDALSVLIEQKTPFDDEFYDASQNYENAKKDLENFKRGTDPRNNIKSLGQVGYQRALKQAEIEVEKAQQKKEQVKQKINSYKPETTEKPQTPTVPTTPTSNRQQQLAKIRSKQIAAKNGQVVTDKGVAGYQRGKENQKQMQAAQATLEKPSPVKTGSVNVGQVIGTKLKAAAQLNPKMAKALIPQVPKILTAVQKFVNYALASSGKKDVKVLGGPKDAQNLQRTLMAASATQKKPSGEQSVQQDLQEAIVEEIFNLLTGKYK